MAIYSLTTTPASRKNGKNAVAMAAYRSGLRLIDLQTGQICDYTRKSGVLEKAIFFPDGVNFDRQELWNMAEQAEKRKDGRVAREILIALPHELTPERRFNLAREYAKELVKLYNIAVDLSIHEPSKKGDDHNFHAHLLLTTRQIDEHGLNEKSNLEREEKFLKLNGLKSGKEQIKELREIWENICNLELKKNGIDQQISAKSYKDRNLDLKPTIHLGPQATEMERKGIETELGTFNRAIKKLNLRLMIRMNRVFYANLMAKNNELIKELEELKKEPQQDLTPQPHLEMKHQKPVKTIQDLIAESSHNMPEKSQELTQKQQSKTIDDLLKRQTEQKAEFDKKQEHERALTIQELLNRNQEQTRQGYDRDKGGIDR